MPELRSVLVVEHDPEIGRPVIAQLAADGYPARLARTAQHARSLARHHPPEVALLCDLETPRAALDLLAEIREGDRWPSDLPVIVVSSQSHEPDLLRAFDVGADDFLAQPASYLELRARLRAILRRVERPKHNRVLRVGPLTIDTDTYTASLHDTRLDLRHMEYNLLVHLASDPRRVFRKQELMSAVWGYASEGSTRTLDSHTSRLRRKLRTASHELWVVNVRGVGYRLI